MKRLFIGVGVLFLLCFLFVFNKDVKSNKSDSSVELTEVEIKTVNETASCKGYLRAKNSKYSKTGCPAKIVYVAVSEGESVCKGDILFAYIPLNADEVKNYIGDIITNELQASAEKLGNGISGTDILSAASYYAEHGEIPPWFSGYYLPDTENQCETVADKKLVFAEFDGVISEVNIYEDDMVSGILGAVLVTDQSSLIAEVGIPEQYIGSVEIGQYANLNVTSFSGEQFAACVTDISDSARTVGSLFGTEETVIDCVLNVESLEGRLIPGLSVRADIFINTWKNAAVIPYLAICSDETGEFVWLYENGRISRVNIFPEYRYAKGVVVTEGFKGGEQLVADPTDKLCNGMAVSIRTEDR
ncbi:MAG: HlyD family efflux transporter periplasmic adaptor subunit [Clostridia bacterium]|nr:HlyD family efflux transporter periplasmic adaptor subunit [Clostridia bacterium]